MSRAGKDTENILFRKDLEVLSAKARLQQTESPGPRMENAASQCDANGGKFILSPHRILTELRGEPSDKRREGQVGS